MRIVSFIQQHQFIDKILRQCGLYEEPSRAPPPGNHGPGLERSELRDVSDLELVDEPAPSFVDELAPREPLWTGD